MGKVIFVTGTDTGVGKTVLTSLLVVFLRGKGVRVLATKPFCSGSWADAKALAKAQDHQLSIEQISPFYSDLPVAPLIAARLTGKAVSLSEVLERIRCMAAQCELLLVEGAGGLLAPLGERYTAVDLLRALRCPVLVVARNRLGAVNHTLLTLQAMRSLKLTAIRVVLMNVRRPDVAAESNRALIADFAAPSEVFEIPYLGQKPNGFGSLRANAKKLQKTLAQLLSPDNVSTAFRTAG